MKAREYNFIIEVNKLELRMLKKATGRWLSDFELRNCDRMESLSQNQHKKYYATKKLHLKLKRLYDSIQFYANL